MRKLGIAVGLAGFLAAGSANATLVYDTITGQTVVAGFKPVVGANRGPLGDSFIASSAETITGLTFQMKDVTPGDGGAVLVYLVPNNPASGAPTLPSSAGTTLNGTTLLGKILDSTVGAIFSAVSISTSATIAAGTYWIDLVDANSPANGDGTGSVTGIQYAYAADTSSLGVPASGTIASYSNANNNGLTSFLEGDVFMMQVQAQAPAPEPASLALLGAGVVGLGLIRRRWSKTSDR